LQTTETTRKRHAKPSGIFDKILNYAKSMICDFCLTVAAVNFLASCQNNADLQHRQRWKSALAATDFPIPGTGIHGIRARSWPAFLFSNQKRIGAVNAGQRSSLHTPRYQWWMDLKCQCFFKF
jgi:hypothetical protein